MIPCTVCETEREEDTLDEHGRCPFCVDKPVPVKEPPPEPETYLTAELPKKKRIYKQITEEERQANVAEAYQIPYTVPQYVPSSSPQQELAQRELARRKLMPFIQRFRPKYLPGWAHEDICRRLERFMKDVEEKKSPRLLIMLPPRFGKQLADDTPVPTPNGWTTHGALKPGDYVFHPSGKPVKVLAVSEKTPSDVKVTFSNGESFYCHENHEWTLYNRGRREWQTIETNRFLKVTRFGIAKQTNSAGRAMYQLPIVNALEFPHKPVNMHPYVLGAWLGDGSAGKPCITGVDPEIIEKIESLGYKKSAECLHQTTGVLTTYFSGIAGVEWPGRMTRELQELGVYNNKRIPEMYQYASVEQRYELLAGLIDTDGTVDRKSRVSITTTSLELAEDILQLCEGLGLRPYVTEVQPSLSSSGIQGKQPYFQIGFQPITHIPVALPRKRVTRIATQRKVGLVSVERVNEGKVGHCIQVDSPDGLYVVGEKLTATHNSEIGSRHFPPWVLGHHPDWEIIAASHTASLTLSFSRYIRDVMRDPGYTAVFPTSRLDPSSQSIENWNLTNGGGYLAAGVGTGITGRGAHILLLDDLVKDIEAADSQTITDNTWEWYGSTAYTRLAPGGGVLGIMTWWSEQDWAGRIQETMKSGEGDVFEIVKYPAINEDGDEYIVPGKDGDYDHIVQLPAGSPVPEDARMTRRHNTAVHPARYDTEAMLRIKRNLFATGQKRVWYALYQQDPLPDEGILFTKEMLRYGNYQRRSDWRAYQAWDFSITEKRMSDWISCTTGYVTPEDDIIIADVLRFKVDEDGMSLVEAMIDQYVAHECSEIGFEDGQIWKSIKTLFKKRCRERKVYPSYKVLAPITDKVVRSGPLRGRMQMGKVFIQKNRPWNEAFIKELTHFPGGKHDDMVDSTAWMVRLAMEHTPRSQRKMPEPKSWKDKLKRVGRVSAGHMAA